MSELYSIERLSQINEAHKGDFVLFDGSFSNLSNYKYYIYRWPSEILLFYILILVSDISFDFSE